MDKINFKRLITPDEANVAISKAREFAEANGKPLNLSRVALALGLTTADLDHTIDDYANSGDERKRETAQILRLAKEENRANLTDFVADKGNVSGYMFLARVNHGMVETTRADVTLRPISFTSEDEIED